MGATVDNFEQLEYNSYKICQFTKKQKKFFINVFSLCVLMDKIFLTNIHDILKTTEAESCYEIDYLHKQYTYYNDLGFKTTVKTFEV